MASWLQAFLDGIRATARTEHTWAADVTPDAEWERFRAFARTYLDGDSARIRGRYGGLYASFLDRVVREGCTGELRGLVVERTS